MSTPVSLGQCGLPLNFVRALLKMSPFPVHLHFELCTNLAHKISAWNKEPPRFAKYYIQRTDANVKLTAYGRVKTLCSPNSMLIHLIPDSTASRRGRNVWQRKEDTISLEGLSFSFSLDSLFKLFCSEISSLAVIFKGGYRERTADILGRPLFSEECLSDFHHRLS